MYKIQNQFFLGLNQTRGKIQGQHCHPKEEARFFVFLSKTRILLFKINERGDIAAPPELAYPNAMSKRNNILFLSTYTRKRPFISTHSILFFYHSKVVVLPTSHNNSSSWIPPTIYLYINNSFYFIIK
ncbi:hypothetical protein PIB30_032707 [Stylosanthes scabra]|uniref:Uncharacterized protein n=1 Tax=Stylosanthes scabra TaxID=79078 RepID=A0ABU6RCG1_9FABA|nr:hypothetical protein [Stylosanthes scabra]